MELENNIKNKSNKELVDAWIFDKIEWNEKKLDTSIENEINEKVEKARQEFLKSPEYAEASTKGKDELQRVFNEDFLDKHVYQIIDEQKVKELEERNKDIRQSIKNLSFDINTDEDDEIREEDMTDVKLDEKIRKVPCILKEVSTNQLNDLIDKINDTTFANKKTIVECLEKWKRENIRKIQYILIGKEYKENELFKDEKSVLPLYWTDWLMWSETYAALNKYIDDNKKTVRSSELVAETETPTVETETPAVETETPTVETETEEPEEERDVTLEKHMKTTTNLKSWEAKQFKEYAEKHDKIMDLRGLENISKEDAEILAWLEGWQIYLNWLKQLDKDVLEAFKNGKCSIVTFPNWEIKNNEIKIAGIKYSTIDDDLCKKLLWNNYQEPTVVETPKPVVETETPVVETETPVVGTETPVVETETPTEESVVTPKPVAETVEETTEETTEEETEEPRNAELESYMKTTQELKEWDAEKFKEYAEKHGNTIELAGLKSISKEDAEILAWLEGWEIYLTWLEQLNTEVLTVFKEGTCNYVKFPNWEIKNKKIKIDGKEYRTINEDLCKQLLGDNYQAPTVVETPKPVVETETPVIETETPVVETETPVVETETQTEESVVTPRHVVENTEEIVEEPEEVENKELDKYKTYSTLTPEDARIIALYVKDSNIENPKLDLWGLKKMDKIVAETLAYIPCQMRLDWLEELDTEILNIFFNAKWWCNFVKFPEGQLVRNSGEIYVTLGENPKHYHSVDINDELCKKLLWNKNTEASVWNVVGESTTVSDDETIAWNNNHVTLSMDTSVQYQTSQTMSKENYTRKYENAKNEKQAIRLLLWLKWFRNQTDDISIWIEWYDINRLQCSDEANELRILRVALEQFLELDESKRASAVFDSFNSIFEQFNQWKKFQWEKSDRISFWNMENYADYVTLNDDWTLKNPDDPFARAFKRLTWLYEKYQSWEWWAYFNNVMWLLENYFIRWWISLEDMQNWWFQKIFEQNNYWKAKWWVDFDNLKIDFDETKWSNDKIRYNEKWEKEFISMLSDFNLDWRLDHNDRWYYMWLELDNIYKSINIDFQNPELSEQVESGQSVWKNIVNFAINYFENLWDQNIANKLKSVKTIDELNAKLKEKDGNEYKTLKSLQTMLKDSPVPISFICKYWDNAPEMFLNEVMMDENFDEMYDAAFDELVKQWVDPQLRTWLKPAIYASYINWGIWGGLWMAYDTKNIWTLSMSLWATHVPWSKDLQYWIVLWWQQKEWFDIRSWNLKFWVNGWYSTQWFLALWNADFVTWPINKKKLNVMDVDAHPVKRIHISANAWYLCGGLYASLKWWENLDYIEWVRNMHNVMNDRFRKSLANIFDDEKFKTYFVDGKLDSSKAEEIKEFIKEKMLEGGDINKDVVDTVVESIYSWLVYFAAGLNFDEQDEKSFNISKNRIIYQLSETYTNKYMSEYIDKKLDGKTKLTDFQIWPAILWDGFRVSSLAKSIYYSVVSTVSFTKYGNTYMKETDQSSASYESRLSSWLWLDYLEWSIDKNWDITQETIDYLNKKLGIIGNYNLDKMKISIQTIDDDESKKVIYIPRDLLKWGVVIHLDPILKDYIESDNNWFKIPMNATMSLLTRSRTTSTQFDLVLWNYRNDSESITLSYDSQFTGKPLEYDPKDQGNKVFDIETINESLLEFSENKSDFPLSTCETTEDGKLSFAIKEWLDISINGGTLEKKDWKIIVPWYGKMIIKKASDWSYSASFTAWNEEKLSIEYDNWVSTNIVWWTWEHLPLWNVFDKYADLDKIFDGIESQLALMDHYNSPAYITFMNAAAELGIDGILDESDYNTAFKKLRNLLLGQLNDPSFKWLKWKLNNATDEEKVMIVDRFKAIFSYNDMLTCPWALWKQLEGRWDKYKELHWYDQSVSFPLTSDFDYRQAVQDELNKKWKFKRELHENLVWMTAFYRLWDKNAWRSYMMTELGWTNVLWDVVMPISNEDIADTKNWFIKNLDKSWVHKDILKTTLSEKIKSALQLEDFELSDDDLKSILNWNNINVYWNNIDIWWKKIRINANYVFYLLWECANESIWVELWDIEIVGGGWNWNDDNEWNTIDITPVPTGVLPGVYVWNVEAANRTVVQKVAQFGGWVAIGIDGGKPNDWNWDWTGEGQGYNWDWTWVQYMGIPWIDETNKRK